MNNLDHTRKLRRKQTAEDFTPIPLVNEMLDKLPYEVFIDPSKTFCDPAAGNGNFLVEVLKRKLINIHPLQSLQTIYGVELMEDNVEEMKERLLSLIPEKFHKEAKIILDHNIICHHALTWDYENWKSKLSKPKALF